MFLYDEVYQQQQYLQHGVVLQQGGTIIDVGANIGLLSMLAAEVHNMVLLAPPAAACSTPYSVGVSHSSTPPAVAAQKHFMAFLL